MKILVTGGAGFIGSSLVDRLMERGDTIISVDNYNDYYNPNIKRRNLDMAQEKGAEVVEADILDADRMSELADGTDVIVHLAARAGVRPSLEQPILYEQVNGLGTLNMLEAARQNKVPHFVFASSSSVYGNCKESPFKEDMSIARPISPYAATKAAGEMHCHSYWHLHGLSVNVMRFFTAYGPRGRPDMAIYKFTRMIDEGQAIPFYGDGRTRRDYTYIDDIVDGLIAAIDQPKGFEIFNLGESATTTLSELVELIEKNLGKTAQLDKRPMQPGDVEMTCADISKARSILGYNPQTPLPDGLKKWTDWYQQYVAGQQH